MTRRDELWDKQRLAIFYDAIFGDPKMTILKPGNATVGTTAVAVVLANPDRKYVLICNDSDTDMYLAIGTTAVLNKGKLLGIKGVYEMNLSNLMTGTISAVTSKASKNLTWEEGT